MVPALRAARRLAAVRAVAAGRSPGFEPLRHPGTRPGSGLAAFRGGQRLGTGGGFYDRSLAFRRDTPAPPWLVGAAYSFQELEALESEAWDVPMDAVVTEKELIEA